MLKACFSPADIGLDGILVLPSFFLFFYFWLFFTRSDLCSSFFQLVGDLSELRDKKYGDVNGKVIVMNDEFGNLVIMMNMIYDDDVNRNVQWKFLTFVIHTISSSSCFWCWWRGLLKRNFDRIFRVARILVMSYECYWKVILILLVARIVARIFEK